MTTPRFVRVLIGLPPPLLARLDAHAEWLGVTRAEAARDALADHLRDAEEYRQRIGESAPPVAAAR
jgi:metal-responsive CopG/Arc/MetJ family transcriptional regulator